MAHDCEDAGLAPAQLASSTTTPAVWSRHVTVRVSVPLGPQDGLQPANGVACQAKQCGIEHVWLAGGLGPALAQSASVKATLAVSSRHCTVRVSVPVEPQAGPQPAQALVCQLTQLGTAQVCVASGLVPALQLPSVTVNPVCSSWHHTFLVAVLPPPQEAEHPLHTSVFQL